MALEQLIGKTLTGVAVSTDSNEYLKFETTDGDLLFYADGDCCSNSYFSEVMNVFNILDGTKKVESIENIDLHEAEKFYTPKQYEEVVAFYGWRIVFDDETSAVISMRNNSNGYYGGSCDFMDLTGRHGTYYAEQVKKLEWITLKDNWMCDC